MYEARKIAEDLLLTAARLRAGDAEEFLEDRDGVEYPAFSERRVVEVLVGYAERIVEDLGIDPESVWTPDVLREQEFTTLGGGSEPVHVERFIVTVAYDPEDVDWEDGDLLGIAENARLEGGAAVRWTRYSSVKVHPPLEDESIYDLADEYHDGTGSGA